jgi:hypothetical protein
MTYGYVQRATERLKLHPYRVLSPQGLRYFWITQYTTRRVLGNQLIMLHTFNLIHDKLALI